MFLAEFPVGAFAKFSSLVQSHRRHSLPPTAQAACDDAETVFAAAQAGDSQALQRLLTGSRARPSAPAESRSTRLTSHRCDDGATPLDAAASGGHAACVRQLLRSGADTEAVDAFGQTPLLCAAAAGAGECVEALLEAFARIDAAAAVRDCARLSSVSRPVGQRSRRKLCRHVFYLPLREQDGGTALHRAAWSGDARCVRALIEAGAAVDAQDKARMVSAQHTPPRNAAVVRLWPPDHQERGKRFALTDNLLGVATAGWALTAAVCGAPRQPRERKGARRARRSPGCALVFMIACPVMLFRTGSVQ